MKPPSWDSLRVAEALGLSLMEFCLVSLITNSIVGTGTSVPFERPAQNYAPSPTL